MLQAHHWQVLGGYMSPSHDAYVSAKAHRGKQLFVNATHRVAMAELATRDSNWLTIGKWEARREGHWPDFPIVAKDLSTYLKRHVHPKVIVFYVCGSDHARHVGSRMPGMGLVVLAREGVTIENRTKPDKMVYWCSNNDDTLSHASSTRIRNAILNENQETLEATVNPLVVQYIVENELYGATKEISKEGAEMEEQKKEVEEEEVVVVEEEEVVVKEVVVEEEEKEEDDDDDLLDFSDAVDGLHADWVQEGHSEAVAGLEGTDIDAMKLGIHHGTQLGYELGYMKGVVSLLSSDLNIVELKLSKRCQDTVSRVQLQLASFPLDEPASEKFQLHLDQLRAAFRKCCSQSKLKNVHNGWRTTEANKEGETKTF